MKQTYYFKYEVTPKPGGKHAWLAAGFASVYVVTDAWEKAEAAALAKIKSEDLEPIIESLRGIVTADDLTSDIQVKFYGIAQQIGISICVVAGIVGRESRN